MSIANYLYFPLFIFQRSYQRIKPSAILPASLVEVQVTFSAVKLGRTDYIFLPKLRSVCILSRAIHSVRSTFDLGYFHCDLMVYRTITPLP